jgi:ech hydrogenase subunit D
MSIEATAIAPARLVAEVTRLKAEGWRLVTLTSVELDEKAMEILYHFDRELALRHLRVRVDKGGTLPSISGVLFGAFLVENEIRDQFGLTFEGLVLDYQGKLLGDAAQTPATSPFCRYQAKKAVAETGAESGGEPGAEPSGGEVR